MAFALCRNDEGASKLAGSSSLLSPILEGSFCPITSDCFGASFGKQFHFPHCGPCISLLPISFQQGTTFFSKHFVAHTVIVALLGTIVAVTILNQPFIPSCPCIQAMKSKSSRDGFLAELQWEASSHGAFQGLLPCCCKLRGACFAVPLPFPIACKAAYCAQRWKLLQRCTGC